MKNLLNNIFKIFALFFFCVLFNIHNLYAIEKLKILNLRTNDFANYKQFVVDISEKPIYKTFELHDPERIVIDIKNTNYLIEKSDFEAGKVIDSIRTGRFENGIRIVLDINTKAKIKKHFILAPSTSKKNWRIAVDIDKSGLAKIEQEKDKIADLIDKTDEESVLAQAPDFSNTTKTTETSDIYNDEEEQNQLDDLINTFVEDEPDAKVIKKPESVRSVNPLADSSFIEPVLKPDINIIKAERKAQSLAQNNLDTISNNSTNKNSNNYTSSRTSYNKYGTSTRDKYYSHPIGRKYNIVIDAGHGGKDPGTIGRGRTKEKVLTLKYAKMLASELKKTGKYNVYLTRKGDYFISLNGRVKKARKYNADLFISIHIDHSSNRRTRGLSVYTLSQKASDTRTAKLARKENKADIIGGLNLYGEYQDTINVLVDLSRREAMNSSSKFAEIMAKEMKKNKIRTLSGPHKFGNFAVLLAPDIPSVLIELGFLSNKADEYTLKTWNFKQNFAKGTVNSLNRYFR